MRHALWLAGLAAITVAGAANAASVPPLRNGASEDEIAKWVGAHIDANGAMPIRTLSVGVEFFNPADLTKTAEGHLVGSMRFELFRPITVQRQTVRSLRGGIEVDCDARDMKRLDAEFHPQNNLEGVMAPLGPGEWVGSLPADTFADQRVSLYCSYADLVGSPDWDRAMPPPFDGDEVGLAAWRERHVTTGDDVFLMNEAGIPTFYTPDGFEKVEDGVIRVRLRQELPRPIVLGAAAVRSTRSYMAIDCLGRRYEYLDLIVFPGANTLGKPSSDFDADLQAWTAAEAGGSKAAMIRALCRLEQAPQTPVGEALRQADAPEPASDAEADVAAWYNRYLNTNGMISTSYTDEFVEFYDPLSVAFRDGVLSFAFRREYFASMKEAGSETLVRSTRVRMDFDCRQRRVREVERLLFPELNLEGAPARAADIGWRRPEADGADAYALQLICGQLALFAEADGPTALAPSLWRPDARQITAWLEDYIDPKDDVVVDYTESGVGFYSADGGERTRQDYLRVWLRHESFEPEFYSDFVVRSSRTLVEFDCEQGRSRILAIEDHMGSNLQGPKREHRPGEAEWTFVQPRTLQSSMANALCGLKDEADEAEDDALVAPRLPSRKGRQPL